jgi:hypothetical protein
LWRYWPSRVEILAELVEILAELVEILAELVVYWRS